MSVASTTCSSVVYVKNISRFVENVAKIAKKEEVPKHILMQQNENGENTLHL